MKQCNGPCGLVKEDKDFRSRTYNSGKVGLRSFCRECDTKARDDWRHKNWNRDLARNNAYNKRNAARIRGHKLRKYWPGCTPEQANAKYQALFDEQGGACAICSRTNKRMHVDHCHEAGTVRGILCGACNRAIGYLQDDPTVVARALSYLARHKPTA